MDKINGSYNHGLDEYGLQLYLQEQLLSKVLNLKGIRVSHLGVIKDRLQYHKVLIILDDVESLDHLEALADIRWFGPGSRVIVTTENKEILQKHGINDIYHVCFPSRSEALRIFCLSAFKQTFPPNGFVDLVDEVTSICGELPLGLHIFGSSLRGKRPNDWIDRLPRLKNCLDGRIESVLKVGYESLDEEDQDLFLLIAVFFNYEHVNSLTSILSNTDVLDVRLGLKNLANRYVIHICSESRVEMHCLLQVMAKRVISKQKVSKRKIVDHAQDICYVLENAKGNGSVLGLSLDVAEINKLKINKKAFKGMYNLHILKVYNGRHCRKKQLHVPEEMEFPPSIRLLHWEAYPGKSLLRFWPENLVKLYMKDSQLEKLWEGTQPLANLKEMNLRGSSHLKELPDLSYATNLEKLDLHHCTTLVKLPSSVANLHKIGNLRMSYCRSLEVIPTLANLTSLTSIMMEGCSRLRRFPNIFTNVTHLMITQTLVEEWPGSLRHCSRLKHAALTGSRNLKTFSTHLPTSVRYLYLDNSCIERIQDCIKWLHNLEELKLSCCKRLLSLPKLPGSLKHLRAENCVSLESVSDPLNTPNAELNFTNCFKLSQQARRAIIQQTFVNGWAILPGREVPAEFDHRARGYYLTFPHSGFNRFKVCVVISSFDGFSVRNPALLCFCSVIGSKHSVCKNFDLNNDCKFQTEHLFIFDISLSFIDPSEVTSKIVLRFKTVDKGFNIIDWGSLIECGVKILTDETDRRNNGGFGDEDGWSYTLEFSEASTEEEDVDSITNERFESDSDNEDHKEGYTYESGDTSKDKDEGSVDDGDYI